MKDKGFPGVFKIFRSYPQSDLEITWLDDSAKVL